MKVSIHGNTDQNEEKGVIKANSPYLEKKKSNLKCKYYDRGFCKSQMDCVYFHSNTICDILLSKGQCPESKTCLSRHPRDCEHWTGDIRCCLRGNLCKYLHNSKKKGINIKKNRNNQEINSESERPNWIVEKEIPTKEKDDSHNEVIAEKDNVIMDKDEEITKLRGENDIHVEDNAKVKRIAWKMDQEIKLLRTKLAKIT